MRERKESRDPRAHRIAHDIGAREPKMIEQSSHILRHDGAVIGGGLVNLAGCAVAAVVERDRATPGACQCRHPAGHDPIDLFVGRKTVNEDDRVARAFVNKGDFHPVVRRKLWHRGTIRSRRQEAKVQTQTKPGDVSSGSG